ncbi:hypothetical protein Nepgr_021097 [Nepenthes gracilis]|uniref:Uncharacterized protein n=1 Tax=Nepenthes gracilis TaxID=150966 RepID=A0AAD3SYG9_NEPGR|nr:hypothetical protein Nepgr_021097 [Nepenthes gracilis]
MPKCKIAGMLLARYAQGVECAFAWNAPSGRLACRPIPSPSSPIPSLLLFSNHHPAPALPTVGVLPRRLLPPPLNASPLVDSDFPSILASRSIAPKSRCSSGSGTPSTRVQGFCSASPSLPTFQSSCTNSLFRVELPDPFVVAGVSLDGPLLPSHLSATLDCADSKFGPSGPVSSSDVSFSSVLVASVVDASVDGVLLASKSRSPCQYPVPPSDGLAETFRNFVSNPASLVGDSGLSSSTISQDCAQVTSRVEPSCPGSQPAAPMKPSISPTSDSSLSVATCPPGVSWSSMV